MSVDLTALIERLKHAQGEDRDLDLALLNVFEPNRFGWEYVWGTLWPEKKLVANAYPPDALIEQYGDVLDEPEWGPRREIARVPAYTASLDATINLIEHKLPRWSFGFISDPHLPNVLAWVAPESHYEGQRGGRYSSKITTPAIALLVALLAATPPTEPQGD